MTSERARALLGEFLTRMDRGELPDFEALAHAHPDLEAELRASFASECERLEAAESGAGADDPLTPGVDDEVLARLERRGADFARYLARGEIGKGGMGVVLHVFDADLRRDLALKIVAHDPRALDRAALARFLEEAQVTSQLDHPGIVPVHEIGIDPAGRLYFTMKLVKGRTFAEVLELVRDQREGWTLARALGVIQRVCEAMAYAHQKGVLHRDLKPANVMVGAFGEVYVMDWGLSRIVGSRASDEVTAERAPHESVARVDSDRALRRGLDPSSSLLTADGQVVGTPAYMPPEQAAGAQAEIGPHSDVYAVGAMLYHLLTGRPPHQGFELRAREGRALAPFERSVPTELAAICLRAMAPDWRERYVDMRAMARDVSDHLEGRVVHAHESGALAEARKWVQRNRGLAAALAVCALMLVAGTITSLAFKARSDAQSVRATKLSTFLEETLTGVSPSIARGRDTTLFRETLDRARVRLEAGELAAAPMSELRLMHLIGSLQRQIGSLEAAEPLLRRAVERARVLLEPSEPERAAILAELGLLLVGRGDAAAGEVLLRESLADRRALHPGDHIDVASALQNLAEALRARGKLEDAEVALRESVAMHERLGAGAERSAFSAANLAVVLHERGRLDEAETCVRRALDLARAEIHGDHPLVASCLNTLASVLGERGDLASAESATREALDMRKRLYSGDHDEIVASYNSLAFLRYHGGDFEGAETYAREAVEMQRRLSPGDHVGVAATLDLLAAALVARGDRTQAETLQLETLAMRRRMFPAGHPDIALGLHNLASGLRIAGDFGRAEPIAREAVESAQRVFPADHPNLPVFTTNLGLILEARGDLDGAIRAFRDVVEREDRSAGTPAASPPERVAQRERNLVRVLVSAGRFAEAEALIGRLDSTSAGRSLDRTLQMAELQEAWEGAQPAAGHAERARELRRSLESAGGSAAR